MSKKPEKKRLIPKRNNSTADKAVFFYEKVGKINGVFKKKDIVSLDQFDPHSVLKLFKEALTIKKNKTRYQRILQGKIAALVFFEPSTRTFSSHAAAFKLLGGQTIEFQNPLSTSSAVKGESLEDMMKMFESYADVVVLRHPVMGTACRAAEILDVPLINAGDGIGEHPTQALLDMFTLWERFGKLEELRGLLVGDLVYGRTIHSLIKGLSLFPNNHLFLLAPHELRLPKKELELYKARGIRLTEIENPKEIPPNCHFWYWTRVQKERFKDQSLYENLKMSFVLTKDLASKKAGKHTLFMHPLPRVGEIAQEMDSDPRSVYLKIQPANGLWVRMALFKLILNERKANFKNR